jgi:hypothetical protein
MIQLKCFKDAIDPKLLDREAFKFRHQLKDHPALTIEGLSQSIPQMPSENVMFSKGLDSLKANFDHALIEGTKQFNLKEIIETLKTSNCYLAVRSPELHPDFKQLHIDMMKEVGELIKAHGKGKKPINPVLWLFIASPNSVTPFHIDRTSNFLMQIRGSKEVAIFPPRHEGVLAAKDTESYVERLSDMVPWSEEIDHYATKFNFNEGEAIHIPFTSGHYVKNGASDISISLSFFFDTDETVGWVRAMKFNNRMRKLGFAPQAVGLNTKLDYFKSALIPWGDRLFRVLTKLSGK